jgi:hypothetical protein
MNPMHKAGILGLFAVDVQLSLSGSKPVMVLANTRQWIFIRISRIIRPENPFNPWRKFVISFFIPINHGATARGVR